MKIARFSVDGMELPGRVDGRLLRVLKGNPFERIEVTRASYPLEKVRLLPPTRPVNYWGVGENYPKHVNFRVEELGSAIAERAKKFTPWHKGAGCIIASGDPVVVPPDVDWIEYEGELCIVIGKPAFKVSIDAAKDHIFGYTVSNDIGSGPAWFRADYSLWRVKSTDTFGPIGPWIETEIADPHQLDIIVRVDGREEDRGNTRDMVHNCYEIVSNISQYVTLNPGDMITTGAPGLTRALRPGEVVEVEIPEIGILRNPVAASE
ncbi:MAG: fumarylacetoacetate hydrolase family protein [Chloroflexota bacterium]